MNSETFDILYRLDKMCDFMREYKELCESYNDDCDKIKAEIDELSSSMDEFSSSMEESKEIRFFASKPLPCTDDPFVDIPEPHGFEIIDDSFNTIADADYAARITVKTARDTIQNVATTSLSRVTSYFSSWF